MYLEIHFKSIDMYLKMLQYTDKYIFEYKYLNTPIHLNQVCYVIGIFEIYSETVSNSIFKYFKEVADSATLFENTKIHSKYIFKIQIIK